MHYELMFPSRYLRASDLRGKDVTMTIATVRVEELTMVGGRKADKPVVYFDETRKRAKDPDDEKRLVINKTNAKTIAAKYGTDTDGWTGKKITLYPAMVRFGGDTVEAIRIREGT